MGCRLTLVLSNYSLDIPKQYPFCLLFGKFESQIELCLALHVQTDMRSAVNSLIAYTNLISKKINNNNKAMRNLGLKSSRITFKYPFFNLIFYFTLLGFYGCIMQFICNNFKLDRIDENQVLRNSNSKII